MESEELSKGTTFLKTCFNSLNALSGVGILSVPYALSQGGWLSLILLFAIAVLCYYTGLLLHRCMNSSPQIKSYPDIGEHAFGRTGRIVISIFIYAELYLVAVEFLILGGNNFYELFPDVGFSIGGKKLEGQQVFIVMTALIILPTTWLRSLGLQAYVSAGGVFASSILVGSVFWIGTVDGVGFHGRGIVLDWKRLTTTLSLFTFCYGGHPVFPTLRNSMINKTLFPQVLLVGFIVATMIYGSMAIIGYLMYGETSLSQITLNLPTHNTSSKVAIYTILINVMTRYAIIILPIAGAIEQKLIFQKNWAVNLLIRTALVFSTVIVALAIPFFEYIMAFIGALLSTTASILFPCLCFLKITYNSSTSNRIEFIGIIVILIIGIFVAAASVVTSVRDIIQHVESKS